MIRRPVDNTPEETLATARTRELDPWDTGDLPRFAWETTVQVDRDLGWKAGEDGGSRWGTVNRVVRNPHAPLVRKAAQRAISAVPSLRCSPDDTRRLVLDLRWKAKRGSSAAERALRGLWEAAQAAADWVPRY